MLSKCLIMGGLVAPPGLEPGLSALKGPRVNQLHHGAKHTTNPATQLYAVCFVETEEEEILVALPGLEPGLFALRGRRVNQLHHNARTAYPQEDVRSSVFFKYSKQPPATQGNAVRRIAPHFHSSTNDLSLPNAKSHCSDTRSRYSLSSWIGFGSSSNRLS